MPLLTGNIMTTKTGKTEANHNLMTIGEVAQSWSTSEKTVRRAIDAGDLPVIQIGRLKRVHPEDNERYIRARRMG